MLNWALKYQRMGYSVIPLKPKSKEPLIKWQEYQKRKATEQEIQTWWLKTPKANIGIVTGLVSGLSVIDADGLIGLDSLRSLDLHSCVIVKTGNGRQLYFQDKEGKCRNSVKKIPGIDIRGEGGYVVAPPSIHPNGNRYLFLTSFAHGVEKLPPFPNHIFADGAMMTEDSMHGAVKKEESWIAKSLEEMKDGNIDETLFRICSRLRNDGYSELDVRTLLSPHAERVGATPGHLEEKIKNVWNRYEPKMERQMRLQSSSEQSLLLSTTNLVIHSPTDSNSLNQYDTYLEGNVSNGNDRSGFPTLDKMCQGRFKSERLFTIAALPGHGKTNFGIALAQNLCRQNKKVLYFSTEYSFKKIWDRYRASLKVTEDFRNHTFYVCDGFTPNIDQVETAIKQIQPDVFIFDYIQHVSKEKEALTHFMKGCQLLQRTYNLQGVILAQLNRTADWVEEGKRIQPRMSMIEGSATIEQASSRVLLLSQSRVLPEYHEILGVLDKNDDGETGLINFALHKNPWRIEEIK